MAVRLNQGKLWLPHLPDIFSPCWYTVPSGGKVPYFDFRRIFHGEPEKDTAHP